MSFTPHAPATVQQHCTLELLDVEGVQHIDTELCYDPRNPYAVTLRFHAGSESNDSTDWVFARELLRAGMLMPVGDGDVHVLPDLTDEGFAAVLIELHAPGGSAVLRAPSWEIDGFLDATFASVPPGSEHVHLSVDDAIAALLGSAAAN